MSDSRVVVVGAGPAGAAISLLLVQRGVEVVLIEREATLDRVFRGEALMPGGLDALRQMGLGDAVDRLPHAVVPCMELYVDGTRVMRADWAEVSGRHAARAVSQPALLQAILDQAAAGPFDLRLRASLVALEAEGGHVDVTVRSPGGTSTIRADLVIGADGRASTVRSLLGIKLRRRAFPGSVAWLSMPAPESQRRDPRFQAFSSRAGLVVLYPSWDGRVRLGLTLSQQDTTYEKARILSRVADIAGEPYASIVRRDAQDLADPVLFKVLVGRAPRWSTGRVLLLGDAAHPMAPVRAQGINLALRDAIVAANHLVPALRHRRGDAAMAATAARVQAEREPEIVTIQNLQARAMTLPLPMRSAPLRSTLLPVMRGLGIAKRIMLRSERVFRHGAVPVRLGV